MSTEGRNDEQAENSIAPNYVCVCGGGGGIMLPQMKFDLDRPAGLRDIHV